MVNILASFIFFTRLPFWRFYQPPKEAYATVVEHWPLVGWLTGGIMAGTLFLACHILPFSIAVILAVIVRLFLTGALHEDGLADFFDGFGGGTDRERTLAIMKDSHIGTYGVIALIFYYRHKNRKAKYELAAKMIEKGEPLPADLEESVRGLSDMESRGIKNMCIGAAVTIFIWALTDSFGLACIGLIVLANGVSQYIIARRTKETEETVEMRKLKEEVDRLKKQQHDNTETVDTEEVNL